MLCNDHVTTRRPINGPQRRGTTHLGNTCWLPCLRIPDDECPVGCRSSYVPAVWRPRQVHYFKTGPRLKGSEYHTRRAGN